MGGSGGLIRFDRQSGEFVSLEVLMDWVRAHPLPTGRIVPLCIWGSRGTGKTQQIKSWCKRRGLQLRTYHPSHDVDGSDIVGRPYIDEKTGRTAYALPSWLPVEADPPGLLFMDEINRAPGPVMQGLMEPLGEGTVSQSGWQLPSHWQIIAAANPGEQGYDVGVMDDAMVDRLLHYAPGWDAASWTAWANDEKLPTEVIDFALSHKELVDAGETSLPLEVVDRLGATPRSFEYLAAVYRRDMPLGLLRVVAGGLLGRDVAPYFVELHNREERPFKFEDLLNSGYEQTVIRWGRDREIDMIAATNTHLVAGMLRREPTEAEAKVLSRYVALLPSVHREEAMKEIDRSAPGWLDLMTRWTKTWLNHLKHQ
jgi:hypothetical protein